MTDVDLAYRSASDLAALIRGRELSPVDLVENALARIGDVNPRLNCFCFVHAESARAKARQAEDAVMSGAELGPLHGLPIAFKDLTPVAGTRTTLGSYVFENWRPERSAAIVDKLTAAGAIIVGKTTTPEFAHAGFTESPLWGVTRNPWNLAHTPGGSSGGSGAAVAAGCVPLAEGTDMGGSVRIPASDCGVVGLKPSLGRIPLDILPSLFDNISHFGPLTRSVADAALFLASAQGPDDRDIQSVSPPLDLTQPLTGDLRGLRLAFSLDLGFYAVHPQVADNTLAAVAALREAGAEVEEVALDWTAEVDATWSRMWGVFMAAYFGQHLETWREKMDPAVVKLIEAGRKMSAVDYKRLEILRSAQWQALAPILRRCDALLAPTMAQPPALASDKASERAGLDDQGRLMSRYMTEPFNLIGQCPVISVPSGLTAAGLPTGLQICGRRFDEPTVLRVATALETRRPWADWRPPLA